MRPALRSRRNFWYLSNQNQMTPLTSGLPCTERTTEVWSESFSLVCVHVGFTEGLAPAQVAISLRVPFAPDKSIRSVPVGVMPLPNAPSALYAVTPPHTRSREFLLTSRP